MFLDVALQHRRAPVQFRIEGRPVGRQARVAIANLLLLPGQFAATVLVLLQQSLA